MTIASLVPRSIYQNTLTEAEKSSFPPFKNPPSPLAWGCIQPVSAGRVASPNGEAARCLV
jgi:hypothetical protein